MMSSQIFMVPEVVEPGPLSKEKKEGKERKEIALSLFKFFSVLTGIKRVSLHQMKLREKLITEGILT